MKVTFLPSGKQIEVKAGVTLLQASRLAGISIPTRCGGKAGCMMCKVEVPGGEGCHLSKPGRAERNKLGAWVDQGTRLACQATVQGSVTVQVPEDKLKAAIRKQLERQAEEDNLW
ncbi:2Fe-2S iron-sulfur cluster-binding protein [Paenibacillus sp. Marseille-Q4541]|uniref:2Fe-2S iron-sulfur cluster-binding protein n=1 Tax=Paenibacillus sp. Marseille-Q4541 TaxID=2831522 RepID=UPI0020169C36|nr:2Fe-2S iron-sulfur cluster-binding protein [Paenibacillus sp. Marseille-Q4541]